MILNISNQILRRNLPDLGPNLGVFLLILAVAKIPCAPPAGSVNEEDACFYIEFRAQYVAQYQIPKDTYKIHIRFCVVKSVRLIKLMKIF